MTETLFRPTTQTQSGFELFNVTGASPAPRESAGPDPRKVFERFTNLMLDLHWRCVGIEQLRTRSNCIGARLADPSITATVEQRQQAVVQESKLSFSATQQEREARDVAKRVPTMFQKLSPDDRTWIVEEMCRCWSDSPLWRLISNDLFLGANRVWVEFQRSAARGPVNSEPCPF